MQRKFYIKSTLTFFTFIIIFNVIIISANAQWVQQISGTTSDLSCIRFINTNTGWACGNGIILKTTNSGNNWFFCINEAPNKPYSIIFPVDSNIVYCIGFYKTILKSTNGGNNWQIIVNGPFGQGDSYQACFFLNVNTGWIAGPDQKMIKTTNGGISFDSIHLPSIGFNHDIFFRNSMEGLYCGEIGGIRKSTNGGITWDSVKIPVGYLQYYFRNLSFVNNLTGWTVTSNQKIFKTTDFGSNWDSLSYVPNGSYGIHYIKFSSANTGYSCGEGFSVFKSTNGGLNWIAQNGNGGHYLYFLNDSVGWKIANLGYIHHTTNGGISFISANYESINHDFKLYQNYPNPFNSNTKIEFKIFKNNFYKLELFDLTGRKIENIFNKFFQKGSYEIIYSSIKLSSGIYYYKLSSDNNFLIKNFILIK